jgi:cytochrome P450
MEARMSDETGEVKDDSDLELRPDLSGIFIGLTQPEAPQEMYLDLIRECPVAKVADFNYTLTRMADVVALNRHPDVRGMGGAFEESGTAGSKRPLIPLDIDGPEHVKWRRLLDPMFSPKTVKVFEPEIAKLCNEIIDSFIDRGRAEMYSEWCLPLPCSMFLAVVGMPMEDLPEFVQFKDDVLAFVSEGDGQDMAEAAGAKAEQYFNRMLDAKRADGADGETIMDLLLRAQVDGRPLDRLEMIDILYLLVMAGLDTLTSSLSCILHWLAAHPAERSRLVADPSGWPAAIEELMRVESPVMYGFRKADEDIVINGRMFPAGSFFSVMWGAANMDPAVFENPTEVRFDRSRNPHIAFASGTHRCLGSHLARLELRVALEVFHRRIPEYTFDPDDKVVWDGLPTRKPNHLPLVWKRPA